MGETPLIRASHNGHPAAVASLLAARAAVAAVDGGDNTPLHWAAMRGHVECVTALLGAGADPHARNKQVGCGGGGAGAGGAARARAPPHPTPPPHPRPLASQDKTPSDLCQPCWSPAFRYARDALAAAGA